MTNSQRLAIVRSHLLRWLSENVSSAETPQPRIVSESILIRDGFYGGRSFHAVVGEESFRGTWFMEPDELKVRNSQGEVVGVFQGEQIEAAADPSDEVETQHPELAPDEQPVSLPMPQIAAAEDLDENTGNDQQQVPKAA